MLSSLRQQVQAALMEVPARRRPALRRSDAPDALLATDLPLAASEEEAAAFICGMTAQGWRVTRQGSWLLLDAEVPVPELRLPAVLRGECGCCISLLMRHQEAGEAAAYIRAVVKASEAGRQPFERLCLQLHAELAAMLRRQQPLPGALVPYLCQAYHDLYHT
ncbi:MAG: hypothetical protein IJZ74_01990 [Clostridia bacterium]|nr:hypothetical protein [Clostridia bacterium]